MYERPVTQSRTMLVKSIAIKEHTKANNYSMFSVIRSRSRSPSVFHYSNALLSETKPCHFKSASLISAATQISFSESLCKVVLPISWKIHKTKKRKAWFSLQCTNFEHLETSVSAVTIKIQIYFSTSGIWNTFQGTVIFHIDFFGGWDMIWFESNFDWKIEQPEKLSSPVFSIAVSSGVILQLAIL